MNKRQSRRRLSVEEAQEYLLRTGFARCGHCGSAMGVNRYKGRQHTYRCNRKAASAFFDCPGVLILAKPLDRDVWEYVSGILTLRDIVARELKKLERQRRHEGGPDQHRTVTRAECAQAEQPDRVAGGPGRRGHPAGIKKAMATLAEQRREPEAMRDEIAGRRTHGCGRRSSWEVSRRGVGR